MMVRALPITRLATYLCFVLGSLRCLSVSAAPWPRDEDGAIAITYKDTVLMDELAARIEAGEAPLVPLPCVATDADGNRFYDGNIRCDDPAERARRIRAAAEAIRTKLADGKFAPAPRARFREAAE
jgi:hypothetical protein